VPVQDSAAKYQQALTLICQRETVCVPFNDKVTLVSSDQAPSKFHLLQQFNMQIVACLELAEPMPNTKRVDGVKYRVSQQSDNVLFPDLDNKHLFYAFVRDVDYSEGLHLIVPRDLSGDELASKMSRVNAITPCSAKLFSIPQQFIMKAELVDDILASLLIDGSASKCQTKHLLTDLLI